MYFKWLILIANNINFSCLLTLHNAAIKHLLSKSGIITATRLKLTQLLQGSSSFKVGVYFKMPLIIDNLTTECRKRGTGPVLRFYQHCEDLLTFKDSQK